MTRDELADLLFPGGHDLRIDRNGAIAGHGISKAGARLGVVGIGEGRPLGIDAAIALSGAVLDHVAAGGGVPLLVLVDTQSQAMARRDELLGLNEYLAHLSKSLALASLSGHRTVGVMYGAAAAGAFIATALSTEVLVAVPGASPSVMDLPSIARITKLPQHKLEEMAKTTPIFAPGLEPLAATGAVHETWDDPAQYADRLDALLSGAPTGTDVRDALGAERRGREKAAPVARAVMDAAARGR